MKKITFITIVILGLAFISKGAFADIKYGYVDVQKILDTVDEGKAAKTDFKKKIDNKKAELEKKQVELKKLNENFEKQKMILSASAVEEKRKELEAKNAELQKAMFTAQSEMSGFEQELSGPILKKIRLVIEKVGRDGGYDFVWEKNEGGIIYAKATYDLTDQVIAQYDKQNGKK